MRFVTPMALAVVLAGSIGCAMPATAAEGGSKPATNPGVVALMDSHGHHLCSGVLVAPQWVLTDSGSMPCNGSALVTGDTAANAVEIDDRKLPFPVEGWPGNDPRKSGAMLLHLSAPVKNVTPAVLSDAHPQKDEVLDIVAFNGPEGEQHTASLGKAPVKALNHNYWASHYGVPDGMTLEGPVDNGSAILRDGKVVGFVQVANPRGFNAEDIAHIHTWIKTTAGLSR